MVLNCRHLQTTKDRRRRAVVRKASLATAMLAILFATPVHAEDAAAGAVSQKEVQAKLAYCEVCHGAVCARVQRLLPDPAARRTAGRVYRKRAAGLRRAQAHQRYNVQCRPRLEPGDDQGALLPIFTISIQSRSAAGRRTWSRTGRKSCNEGIARRRRSAMRLMPRPRGQGERPVSSAGGSALSLSGRPIDQLG